MIVLGADMHKRSHTIAAVAAAKRRAARRADGRGRRARLCRGAGVGARLGDERVWALEDCRHVSGAFERFLLVHGERVVRVAARLTAGERRGGRDRGKSDRIDAIAVARAALREGLDTLPVASWPASSSTSGCWSITASGSSACAPRSTTTCSGTCTTSGPSWRSRAARCSPRSGRHASRGAWRAPSRPRGSGSPATSCATCASSPHHQRARDRDRRARRPGRAAAARRARLRAADRRPSSIGEIAGAHRFSSDAKLARAGGIAPIPVSSGNTNRHRLDRGGNRQINTAIHRVAVTRAALPPRDQGLPRPQTRRRQDHPRRHPLPQTPPRPPHLAPTPAAPPRPRNSPTPSIS